VPCCCGENCELPGLLLDPLTCQHRCVQCSAPIHAFCGEPELGNELQRKCTGCTSGGTLGVEQQQQQQQQQQPDTASTAQAQAPALRRSRRARKPSRRVQDSASSERPQQQARTGTLDLSPTTYSNELLCAKFRIPDFTTPQGKMWVKEAREMMQEDTDFRAFVETVVPLEDWIVMYIGELARLREEGFAELVVQLHAPEGQTLDEEKEATLSNFAAIKPNTEYGARRFEMYTRSMGYEQCALCKSGHVTPGVFAPSTALRKNETLHRLKSTSKVWVFRETQGLRRAIKALKTLKANNLVSVEGAVCQRCWLPLGKARHAPNQARLNYRHHGRGRPAAQVRQAPTLSTFLSSH